jgi:hypothetical protein
MDAVGSGPKQVAVMLSPEGDPTLKWVRPVGRLPVTLFTGAQTERPSDHINNHPEAKSKSLQKFFQNFLAEAVNFPFSTIG